MIKIKTEISKKLGELLPNFEGDFLTLLETPADKKMGDIALPCFKLSKQLREPPFRIAERLVDGMIVEGISRVEAVNGYLNFFVDPSYNSLLLKEMLEKGEDYGKSDVGVGKRMIIDYSSPNIAKRFHIGHLGTTIIGNSIKKIHKFCGYECVGINYLGDWGTQYGKLVVSFKRWGNEKDIYEKGIEELDRLYVLFGKESENDPTLIDAAREEFANLEKGDEENLRLWRIFKQISLDEYMKTYNLLGISFESFNGESFYSDKMQPVVDELQAKGISKLDDGATIVDLEAYKMPPLMVLKTDGSTAYATRDLAAAIWRYNEYKFDKSIYVTSAGQSLHFAQFFKVLKLMGYDWTDKLQHVPYGTFSINGEKIASRTGNVVLIDDLFKDAIEKAYTIIEQKNPELENKREIAEAVGLGAVIFNSLLANRIKDVSFNWSDALSFEGNTGPYVQYTYARTCSVIEKSGAKNIVVPNGYAPQEEETSLIKVLLEFPKKVLDALEGYEPSVLTRYSLDVCAAFNVFYHNCNILKSEGEVKDFRLALTQATKNVLGNTIELIGLRKTEKI